MMPSQERLLIPGPAGEIEVVVDYPSHAVDVSSPTRFLKLAMVAHPHPLQGGTLDNKVAYTLAKTMTRLGYVAVRPNFRGVGKSSGVHDEGRGETDDLMSVLDTMAGRLTCDYALHPPVFAGFSFGTLVLARVAQIRTAKRMIMVGTAVTRGKIPPVPTDSIVIHGECDDVVPLAQVLDWASPQELPVTVIPGADHFFHRRLHIIERVINLAWRD